MKDTPTAYRATPRRSEESDGQMALFDLLARLEGRWPLLQYVTHVANESSGANKVRRSYRKKDGTTGYKMVPLDVLTGAQMGVKKGVPDIVVFCSNRCAVAERGAYYFIGLTVEAKTETGRMSPDQARWSVHLTAEGWYCYEYYGDWRPAARLIIEWVGGDPSQVEGL
jgi:hypothetical protein